MKVNLRRANDRVHLIGHNTEGAQIHIDGSEKIGGTNAGVRPMEALLAALGSCASMDMITILNKQRAGLSHFELEVSGTRKDNGKSSPFDSIHIEFILNGDIDHRKAERAAQLSVNEYCSVADTIRGTATITHSLRYLATEG